MELSDRSKLIKLDSHKCIKNALFAKFVNSFKDVYNFVDSNHNGYHSFEIILMYFKSLESIFGITVEL